MSNVVHKENMKSYSITCNVMRISNLNKFMIFLFKPEENIKILA